MAEGFKPGFTARSAGSREREKEAERIMNLDSVDLGMRAALSGLVPAGVSVCAVHACAPRREEERDLAVIQGPLKCPRAARIPREAVPYLCVHQCSELHRVMHALNAVWTLHTFSDAAAPGRGAQEAGFLPPQEQMENLLGQHWVCSLCLGVRFWENRGLLQLLPVAPRKRA